MNEPVTTAPTTSLWRTTPKGLVRLLLGLVLFGAGDALVVRSGLGNSPWTVLAEGVAVNTALSIGVVTIMVGMGVLLMWIPLGVRPGLGTILNIVVIGLVIDATLAVAPDLSGVPARLAMTLAGIALVGLGSGIYLGERLGPGPRDGLMTGLYDYTRAPIWAVRAGIEVTVLAVGALLGGTAGVGTLLFALLIGPSVNAGLWVIGDERAHRRSTLTGPS